MTFNKGCHSDYYGTSCGNVWHGHKDSCPPQVCPPFRPDVETVSTGPLHLVPADNRAELFIVNPTNCEATVVAQVRVCIAPPPGATTPIAGTLASFTTQQTTVFGPIPITIPAGACFEAAVGLPNGTNIVDVIYTGPFIICDGEPVQGGIEASVGIGPGRTVGGVQQIGLSQISTFVPFGDLVLAVDDTKKCY